MIGAGPGRSCSCFGFPPLLPLASGIATCITGGLSAVQLLQFSSPRRDFGQESKSGKVSFVSSPLDYGSELLGDNKVEERERSNERENDEAREVIHVRAERVRREKINEKLRCLQDLVPGCYKVAVELILSPLNMAFLTAIMLPYNHEAT